MKADLTTLAADAGDQLSSQIGALKSALTDLQGAVKGLGDGTSTLGNVRSALAAVSLAAGNLLDTAKTRCPSASPSP